VHACVHSVRVFASCSLSRTCDKDTRFVRWFVYYSSKCKPAKCFQLRLEEAVYVHFYAVSVLRRRTASGALARPRRHDVPGIFPSAPLRSGVRKEPIMLPRKNTCALLWQRHYIHTRTHTHTHTHTHTRLVSLCLT